MVHHGMSLWLVWVWVVSAQGFTNTRGTTATTRVESRLYETAQKPILVVGGTGQVGRRVVQQLLAQNRPVRALVRNATKAHQIFGTVDTLVYPPLEVVVGDLARYDTQQNELERAVEGCESIISVSGTMRFSKLSDFLPWRLFRTDVSSWCDDDRGHPYYANYLGQKLLIDLAAKYNIQRFVRLTGLSVGLPAFSLVSVLFSGLLSMTSRYHFLTERYLRESSVPYVILRPGGLATKDRNVTTTSLQVDTSGILPPPARVGRSDVAALAVAACDPTILGTDKSYTLAVRWVGDVVPRPQGTKQDGCLTAVECLQQAALSDVVCPAPKHMKPYGLAVGLFFYSFAAIVFKILLVASSKVATIFR